MTKNRLMTVALLLIFETISIGSVRAQGLKRMTETSEQRSALLSQVFVELGKDYDCFFTIEEAWKDKEFMNAMESQRVQRFSSRKNLQQELEQLRQTVPNFTYEVDKSNPRIVHIIDSRLAQQKGYGLESVINSIDFTGTVFDLVNAIGAQGIPVSSRGLTFTHEQPDYRTVVHVKGEGLKVRDALSNFISLDRHGRILWIARTRFEQGEVSYIHFYTPAKKP